jgi:hypothetical protein
MGLQYTKLSQRSIISTAGVHSLRISDRTLILKCNSSIVENWASFLLAPTWYFCHGRQPSPLNESRPSEADATPIKPSHRKQICSCSIFSEKQRIRSQEHTIKLPISMETCIPNHHEAGQTTCVTLLETAQEPLTTTTTWQSGARLRLRLRVRDLSLN